MTTLVDDVLTRHESVFIDTNLFILFIVGLIDRNRIADFKRTNQFDTIDFDILLQLVSKIRRRCITSNVATETDNLVRQLPDRYHEQTSIMLKEVFKHSIEIHTQSLGFFGSAHHAKFGLTDAILITHSRDSLILTDDYKLAGMIDYLGGSVLNFSQLKSGF
jgi:hypothetical protein